MSRTASRIRVVFLLVGLTLFVYLVLTLGPEQIVSTLARIGWGFVWVAAMYAGFEVARTSALALCLVGRERPSFWDLLRVRISGETIELVTLVGPFVAEPAKAWLLKQRGLPTVEAFAAVIAEYLIYTFTSAAMSIAGLVYMVAHYHLGPAARMAAAISIFLMAVFLLVSAIAIVFRIYLIGAVIQGVARLPVVRRRFRPDMAGVRRMEDLLLLVLRERPVRFLGIVGVELVAQALRVFEVYLILKAMALSVPLVYPFLIEAAIKFIRQAFFFIPSQIGAAEGTYAVIFEALGLAGAGGFTLSLVRRLRTLLVAGVGIACLSWLGSDRPPIRGPGQ
jgi:hypothetical protein